MNLPSADELRARLKQRLGDARIAWGTLTDNQRLTDAGREQRLTGRIQARYAISCAEANRQAKRFMDKYNKF